MFANNTSVVSVRPTLDNKIYKMLFHFEPDHPILMDNIWAPYASLQSF